MLNSRTTLCALLLLIAPATFAADIVVTIDDLPVVREGAPLQEQMRVTKQLVAALRANEIPAVGFVNAGKLHRDGRLDARRVKLLEVWLDAGMELGNHTYAHRDLHEIGVAKFRTDIESGDRTLRAILEPRGLRPRYFRHPFLHTGRTADDRENIRQFLAARGYRVAPVTIDNSDWIYAVAYRNTEGKKTPRERVVDDYIRYMVAKANHYDAQARRLFDRSIPQVLLIHANELNADVLGRLADALRRAGHRFVPLDRALADAAYASPDEYFGPAGISWIDRWAITRGVPRGFFAGEPPTPEWILKLAEIESE